VIENSEFGSLTDSGDRLPNDYGRGWSNTVKDAVDLRP
jgi:hypothetical protein